MFVTFTAEAPPPGEDDSFEDTSDGVCVCVCVCVCDCVNANTCLTCACIEMFQNSKS